MILACTKHRELDVVKNPVFVGPFKRGRTKNVQGVFLTGTPPKSSKFKTS